MSTVLLVPLLVPLSLGALLLLGARLPINLHRAIGISGALIFLITALGLLAQSIQGGVSATLIGDWPAPYGIVLVCDRLSALMLTLTGLLAVASLLSATDGSDARGRHFHALFQFQLFGLAGAFLTGDLFNLFVFFEVLLIASYGLLMHGGGAARTRATLQYLVLNLIGSSLFLMGAAMIYDAAAGSLNMAHLASALAGLPPADAALAGAGGMLLVAVFALKAALLPLHAWMVPAYAAAAAPVAVLFAMLTKVGVYALLRLLILLAAVGPSQPILAPLGLILTLAAVLTIAAGSLGVMASASLRPMIAYLVMVSIGTLLAGIAPGTSDGLAAALYYLIHTTLITGGLFLLADLVAAGRAQGGRLVIGERPPSAAVLAPLFLLGALAIVGLPPLSGFLGKVLILDAVKDAAPLNDSVAWPWVWGAVLGSSMLVLLGLSRAGVLLLWHGPGSERARPTAIARSSSAVRSAVGSAGGLERGALVATIGLLSASPLLMLFAGPVTAFTLATARQTLDNSDYVAAVATLVPTSQAVSARTEGLQP